MTKKFLAITAALALTTPFLATARKQPQVAIERNNLIIPPIENLVVAEFLIAPIPRPKNNPNYCPHNEPYSAPSVYVVDVNVPQHCVEINCGLGVYSARKDSDQERCSYCGSLKPADL